MPQTVPFREAATTSAILTVEESRDFRVNPTESSEATYMLKLMHVAMSPMLAV